MRKLIFALAFGAILIPNLGYALGLGEIEVNSSLNQKLAARIDLISTSPEDAETLIVKLSSREEFTRAGLDRPMVLSSLRFSTSVEDGRVFVEVVSPKPIREPFLNFLVEVDWPQGHLIREYTILLDPPIFMANRAAKDTAALARPSMSGAVSSAPAIVQSSAAVIAAPVAVDEEAFVADEPVQQQTTYAAPSYTPPAGHRVEKGDTAWSIANRMKMQMDDSISTQQMLIALLRENPEVFIDGNVNALRTGYILRTPDYDDVRAVDRDEAKEAVRQQNALWREYQQSLSSDQPASAIDDVYEETEYSAAVEATDGSRLSIVSAGGSSASGEMKDPTEMSADELREQLALARERVETERVQKETLQGQVSTLTSQVDEMKSLLTIESDALAEIQALAGPSDDPVLAGDDNEVESFDTDVAELNDEEQALDALDALTGETNSQEVAEEATEELYVDELDATEQAQITETLDEEIMSADMEPSYAPEQEAGIVATLLNNKLIILGLLVLLLVIGAGAYLIKRRRDNAGDDKDEPNFDNAGDDKDEPNFVIGAIGAIGSWFKRRRDNAGDELDEPSLAESSEDIANMVDDASLDDLVSDEEVEASMAEAESVAEEEFDAEATMILPSGTDTVVTPAADLQPAATEEEPQDDVMAEADVYLAYGIYQQAEELLEAAIKDNPDKDNYRVKLAETYFAGKNAEAFAKLGVEMKQRLGDEETPAWAKVAAMGKELCPDEDVFQQVSSDTNLDVNDLMPKSPEPMDIDLGDDSAAGLDLDFDSPMDETAIISPDDSAGELEFDLSETDAIEESPAEEEFSLDIEASELDLDIGGEASDDSSDGLDMDLDMSMDSELDMDLDMSVDSESEASAEEELDLSMDLDMSVTDDVADSDLGLNMSMDSEPESEEELDLSDDMADLDLSMDDIATADDSPASSDVVDDDLGGMDLSEPLDVDEVNTKLDLAKAYLDMGDNEGARDILDEVLAGGNADQKKEAQELMAQAN